MKRITRLFTKLTRFEIVFIFSIFVLAFFLRSYALYRDLFFAYDQGRDAWEMVRFTRGDFTLIGPTTGLAGVFLGPFWFYLLFPFYVLGGGHPLVPAYGMVALHALAAVIIYFFSKQIAGKFAGIVSALLFTFSFTNIMFARWLSNPTPLPLFSLLSFGSLWWALSSLKHLEGKRFSLGSLSRFVLTGVLFGLCLQLEAANAVWYIPTIFLVFVAEVLSYVPKKTIRSSYALTLCMSGIALFVGASLTAIPQMLFELQWNFLISKNIVTAFQTTHGASLAESFPKRVPLLFHLYAKGIFPQKEGLFVGVLAILLVLLGRYISLLRTNRGFRIIFLWFCVPLFFHSIYTGNYGNFWDYYVIAQHTALYLCIGVLIGYAYRKLPRFRYGVLGASALFGVGMVALNMMQWKGFLTPYEDRFSLSMQVDATKWMSESSDGKAYGVWVYTPNYQDEAHRYVFYMIGKRTGVFPKEHVEQQPVIYLVVEDDADHLKRRNEWIEEKKEFGTLVDQKKFGAITVFKLENTYTQ